MGSLIEELRRREAAARAEAGRLRARNEELSGDLARAEERVSRLAITREEVMRVLEEPPAADGARQDGGPGAKPGPASPIGTVTVPQRQEGTKATTTCAPCTHTSVAVTWAREAVRDLDCGPGGRVVRAAAACRRSR
jgi:hypothetical protein